jgi:hypothetical protein
MVADNPDQKFQLKMFHAEIINDHTGIKSEEDAYVPLPKVRTVSQEEIEENYKKIKADIQELIATEFDKGSAAAGVIQDDAKSVNEPTEKAGAKNNAKIHKGLKNSKKPEKKTLSL